MLFFAMALAVATIVEQSAYATKIGIGEKNLFGDCRGPQHCGADYPCTCSQ
jgi:hypothetical protein